MKKVIKHGKIKEQITFCPKCECEFSYEDEDIIKKENNTLISTSYGRYIVYCPDCGAEIEIWGTNQLTPSTPYIPYNPPYPYNPYTWPTVTYTSTSNLEKSNTKLYSCKEGECECLK